MAKTKLFISFDFDYDYQLKASLIGQARQPDSPFAVQDYSLNEAYPDNEWTSRAQRAIGKCDVFVVLLGRNTHNAQGVQREVAIARGYRKQMFQLRPQGKTYGEVKGAGEVHVWKWKNIKELIA